MSFALCSRSGKQACREEGERTFLRRRQSGGFYPIHKQARSTTISTTATQWTRRNIFEAVPGDGVRIFGGVVAMGSGGGGGGGVGVW